MCSIAPITHGAAIYGLRSAICRSGHSHAGSACAITHISFKSGRSRSYSVLRFVIKTASSTREACRGPCSETTGCSGCVRRVYFRWRCSAGSVLSSGVCCDEATPAPGEKSGSQIEAPERQRSGVFLLMNNLRRGDARRVTRIVIEDRRQPALGFGNAPALAPCVILDLIALDLADAEIMRLRMTEI